MERRSFVKGLAAGLAAAPLLPRFAHAAAEPLQALSEAVGSASGPQALWSRVRKEFLLNPGLVHLNCGSLGTTPRLVVDAVAALLHQFEGDPVDYYFGAAEEVSTKASAFLGAAREEIAVTRNTTEGMNLVATGLRLQAGDEVLTTNHEHGGGMLCWQYLAKHVGVKPVYMKMPAPVASVSQILDLVESSITPRTKVCSFSHVETITGLQMPLAEIAKITRPRDILLVCDGAQAPGMLKIDLSDLGVDAYASSSHKWMLAPKGSGLLYVRKEVQDRVQPVALADGYGKAGYSASIGTQNVALIFGHGLAMDFHNAIGRDRVEARCRQLSARLRDRLAAIPALRLLTPSPPELSSGIVSFAVDPAVAKNSKIAAALLDEHHIRVKVVPSTYSYVPDLGVPREDYNALRFSTHIFNDEEEVDRLADLLVQMLKA